MKLSTQPYKGTRDFYPADKRIQKYMFEVMRQVVERFGYEEYDAPILEPIELYLSKTSQEIVAEQTYSFTDRGGRNVTLRPEMTPTVSRMVAAKRQELSYPLRWYSIPNVWRYERPQHGRLREHWQLNVDLFGVAGLEADHEMILVADSIMRAYGAKPDMYEIRLSSRMLINWILLEYLRLEYDQAQAMMRLIDRMRKMTQADFVGLATAILSPAQRQTDLLHQLISLLKIEKLDQLPLVTQQHPAVAELSKLIDLLTSAGITNVVFDMSLMRGFDYYTDVVFEVFDTHPQNNRSMFGGGRYDGLVGAFGVDPVPTVGFGMGDVTLQNFLAIHNLLPLMSPSVDANVILVGDNYEAAQKTLADLRAEGVRLAVDSSGRKLDAQIKSAVKSGVRYAIFIGEEELKNQRFKLKDLKNGKEQELSFERLVSTLAAQHLPNDKL